MSEDLEEDPDPAKPTVAPGPLQLKRGRGVQDLGSGFRVWGLGIRVQGLGYLTWGLGIQGSFSASIYEKTLRVLEAQNPQLHTGV